MSLFLKMHFQTDKEAPSQEPGGGSSCRAASAPASRPCVSNAAIVRGCRCAAMSPILNASRFVHSEA